MVETKVAKFHSRLAKNYSRAFYGDRGLEIGGIVEWKKLMKFLPKKKSIILDAGGGTGDFSIKLASLGHKVVLTDISIGMLREAKKKIKNKGLENKIIVLEQDITAMKALKSNSFDFIISVGDPVSYCKNPAKAISELARVAKKGAYIFITVDSYFRTLAGLLADGKLVAIRKLERTGISKFRGGDFDQHNFKIDELRALYQKSGLEVVDVFGMADLANKMPKEKLVTICKNKAIFKKIIELELKYASEPSIVGTAGHLGVVGRKIVKG